MARTTWWSSNLVKDHPDVVSDTEMDTPQWSWTELEAGPRGPEAAAREKEETELRHRNEVEQAYRRGLADGEDSGATRARAELKAVMSATLEALEEIRANRVEWAARLTEDVTVLAGAMARQIVDRALNEHPEIFAELASKAVACFQVDEPVRIRLHPADLDQLHESGTADDVTGYAASSTRKSVMSVSPSHRHRRRRALPSPQDGKSACPRSSKIVSLTIVVARS